MKVLSLDEREGIVKVLVEDIEDLWNLRVLVKPGDLIEARTVRMVKLRTEIGDVREGRRFPMDLTLRVKSVEFDRYGRRLRIRGIVVEAPEKFEGVRGSYHTINVKPGSTITVRKERMYGYELERLKKLCVSRFTPVILVSIDRDEASTAVLRGYGYEVYAEIQSRIPGKSDVEGRGAEVEKFYSEVAGAIVEAVNSLGGKPLIVVLGPEYYKNSFAEYFSSKYPEYSDRIRICAASSGGISGLAEALRSGSLSRYISECRAVEESILVEEVLKEVGRDSGLAAYGFDEVEKLSSYGVVKLLLVSEKMLDKLDSDGWSRLYRVVESVERMGGEVRFIGCDTEAHDKLIALGGILALLRYPYAYR
ncbi:MAG: mRNA surveillance protein pelota [Candidatus Bathyarchaeia archaeon]